jgi:hypothetical protein
LVLTGENGLSKTEIALNVALGIVPFVREELWCTYDVPHEAVSDGLCHVIGAPIGRAMLAQKGETRRAAEEAIEHIMRMRGSGER